MIAEKLHQILEGIPSHVTLVAVSKTKPNSAIMSAYEFGQRDFGENKVQDLATKAEELPNDIHWHMIGHLQSNKVKYIAPFVHLIHAVDSFKLLKEINKRAQQNERVINCLLQIHIAQEQTKFGFSESEVKSILSEASQLEHVCIRGLMGMATYTTDIRVVRQEFASLKNLFDELKESQPEFEILSMGMSGDYVTAIEEGSTMVRVGSAIFGGRA
jgi:pyridoxal phosphate enzyme (YggS family)